MKQSYRGFRIWVAREKALGGWDSVYFTVVRESDGWILEDSFTDGAENVREVMKHMKKRVDYFHENPARENPPELEELSTHKT